MSTNDNDLLDSLLDSLSDDQEMEKKIDAFARNKERQRRIQRARETSEQFQQTYSRNTRPHPAASAPQENEPASDEAVHKTQEFSGTTSVNPPAEPKSNPSDEAEIPNFVGSGAVGSTIPLHHLPDSLHEAAQAAEPDDGTLTYEPQEDYEGGATITHTAPDYNTAGSGYSPYGAPDIEETRTVHPAGYSQPVHDEGSTRVFAGNEDLHKSEPGGGTVRVNNDEIRSLLEKDEPILKREYIRDDGEDYDDYNLDEPEETYRRPARRKKKKSNTKTYLIIGCVVLAVLAVVGGGFAIKNVIDSTMQSSQNSGDFNRLLSWVQNYESYDDAKKKDILNYRKVYDKLSDEQKAKINDALESSTGQTFDQLLAAAQLQDKPQSSNENVANAERKAKLKDSISSLKADITILQGSVNEATTRIQNAENAYNTAKNEYDNAVNTVNAAQNTVNSLAAELNAMPDTTELQKKLSALQLQYDRLGDQEDDSEDDSSGSSNSAAIDEQRRELMSQINELQQQLNGSSDSDRYAKEQQLNDAQRELDAASADLPNNKSAMETAYGAWQAIRNDAAPYQNQIDAKNAEIEKLQAELDSID